MLKRILLSIAAGLAILLGIATTAKAQFAPPGLGGGLLNSARVGGRVQAYSYYYPGTYSSYYPGYSSYYYPGYSTSYYPYSSYYYPSTSYYDGSMYYGYSYPYSSYYYPYSSYYGTGAYATPYYGSWNTGWNGWGWRGGYRWR